MYIQLTVHNETLFSYCTPNSDKSNFLALSANSVGQNQTAHMQFSLGSRFSILIEISGENNRN